MQPAVVDRLWQLNRDFYTALAEPFAASRAAPQAGWQRLAPFLPQHGMLLDAGCGNGRLAHFLHTAQPALGYVGVDGSAALLSAARRSAAAAGLAASFIQADLAAADWPAQLPQQGFAAVALLAVLHHVPGWAARVALLHRSAAVLAANGVILLSVWQFLNEDRLRRRLMPWNAAGLQADEVEPEDYLLDWQRGGTGLRYCHWVSEAELAGLAAAAGLAVRTLFYADGRSGRLNLFAVLQPVAHYAAAAADRWGG